MRSTPTRRGMKLMRERERERENDKQKQEEEFEKRKFVVVSFQVKGKKIMSLVVTPLHNKERRKVE